MATSARAVAASDSGDDPMTRRRGSPSSSKACCISVCCMAPAQMRTERSRYPPVFRRRSRANAASPLHSAEPTGSASTIADAPAAAARSAAPSIRVSDREIGPDCIRSRAFPAATDSLSSIRRTASTRARDARVRATAPPISPAPIIATRDIRRSILLVRPCQPCRRL